MDLASGPDAEAVRHWIEEHRIRTLNVAGPRESKQRGIHDQAVTALRRLLV